MLPYAFTPERDLPADLGFALFGPVHLAVLGALAAVSAGIVVLGCRMGEARRVRLLKLLAAAMIGLEIWKNMTLGIIGAFSIGYLPLHLCSMAMFICLYFAWHPRSDGAGQLVWGVVFSGGVAALMFPDWTHFPVWHFQSVHSFVYHAMLVQFSLIAVISGMARPRVSRVWKTMLFLALAAAVVYPIDAALGANYMFLRRPLAGTPLALCARLPGRWGYLLGYGLLALLVLVALDIPFSGFARWKQVHGTDGQT